MHAAERNRIVRASSNPGDLLLDFFAGSGTLGQSALELGRRFILIDDNPEALAVMAKRFAGVLAIQWVNFTPPGQAEGPAAHPADLPGSRLA
jgi:site-specific DNA-methyltransferase (adenine-specific)